MPTIPDLPQPVYLWPAPVVAARYGEIRRSLVAVLLERAEHPEERRRSLTCWPHLQVSAQDYERFWSYGDKQRQPPADKNAAEARTPSSRSRMRRECNAKVNTALCCVYLASLDAVSLPGRQGLHIALDILDGVRTKIDARGLIVEHGTIPMLTDAPVLAGEQVAAIQQLAVGRKPSGLDGLGHFASGELLSILANRMVALKHLLDHGIDPTSDEARQVLRPRQPMGLHLDEATRAAARALQVEFQLRRIKAAETLLRYQRLGRTPACGRYV